MPKLKAPTNNKAIASNMSMLFEMIANDKISLEKADMLLKATDRYHRSLEYELKRAKTFHELGKKDVLVREVEIKGIETETKIEDN